MHVARIAQAFVGTALVALVGVIAAQLWGSVAGLVALGLAAVYLPFILVGGAVMSEPLFDVFMLASLAAALAHRRSPHRYRWALLAGVLGGLAALTRAQALILLVPLAIAVWDGRPWRARAALGPPLALVLVALLTITPWTIRNARELHAFVPISTQFGSALAGTYNDAARGDTQNPAAWQGLRHVPDYAYLFNRVGETTRPCSSRSCARPRCTTSASTPPTWRRSAGGTRAGCSTSRACAARAPRRRRSRSTTSGPTAGILCFWVFAALALAGAFTAMARRTPWFVWAMPILSFLSVVFLVVETPRYRTPIDPFLVLLATAALVTAARRRARDVDRSIVVAHEDLGPGDSGEVKSRSRHERRRARITASTPVPAIGRGRSSATIGCHWPGSRAASAASTETCTCPAAAVAAPVAGSIGRWPTRNRVPPRATPVAIRCTISSTDPATWTYRQTTRSYSSR